MSDGEVTYPPAGEGRFWNLTHQPHKKAAPLRVELRESISKREQPTVSLSRLIGFEDTIADETQIQGAMLKIRSRAARVDEFVGIITDS